MDQIQQAYGDDDYEPREDEEEQTAGATNEREAVSEEEEDDRGRGSNKRAAERPPPMQERAGARRRRRQPQARLPDAGALLDGPQPSARRAATAAAAIALALAPSHHQHQQHQHQQLVGPPLHDGNFPFLVYVTVPTEGALADALVELAATAAPTVPGFEPLVRPPRASGAAAVADAADAAAAPAPPPAAASASSPPDVPLHISLTRAGTVRLRQAAPLVAALGRQLSKKETAKGGGGTGGHAPLLAPTPTTSSGVVGRACGHHHPPPIALLGRPRAFLNDDRTRSFLVLTALDPDDEDDGGDGPPPRACAPALLCAIARCDAALRGLGLPPYYRDGQPHVSLGSAPASSHAAVEAAAGGPVAEAVARMMAEDLLRGPAAAGAPPPPRLALPYPPGALCQIGKRRHVVWGEAPPLASSAAAE